MAHPYLRPLGFGELLDAGFTLYRRHFATLVLTAAICFVPASFFSGLMMRNLVLANPQDPTTGLAWVPAVLVGAVAMLVCWGALTRDAEQAITGGEMSLGDGFRRGARAFFPLLGVTLLAYIAIVGVVVVGTVAIGVLAALGGRGSMLSIVLGIVAGVAAVVLMLAVFASLFAVVPAVVVEGKGPIAALRRSNALSKGARLRILGVLLVTWLIAWLPMMGAMMAAGLGSAIFNPEAATAMTTGQLLFQQLVGFLSSSLTIPFFATCTTLLYYDRRVRLEAYDLEVETQELALRS